MTERRIVLAALPPQPFTVLAEPSGARVRIVNIEEPYRAGMTLGPGEYEVEVSATGYTAARETIEHGSEATERRIVLAALPPQPFTVVKRSRVQRTGPDREHRRAIPGGDGIRAGGQYEVEVSAAGYTEAVRETVRHGTRGDRAADRAGRPAAPALSSISDEHERYHAARDGPLWSKYRLVIRGVLRDCRLRVLSGLNSPLPRTVMWLSP